MHFTSVLLGNESRGEEGYDVEPFRGAIGQRGTRTTKRGERLKSFNIS